MGMSYVLNTELNGTAHNAQKPEREWLKLHVEMPIGAVSESCDLVGRHLCP